MYGIEFIANASFLVFACAWQLGFLDFISIHDEAEDQGPAYDPNAYDSETIGTAGADSFDNNTGTSNLAFLLEAGDDVLLAADGNDYADGGDGNDDLTMRDGDDIAAGGAGNDSLSGGNGNDALWGQEGDDYLEGHGGDDSLYGGSGADTLEGGYGDDLVEGGSGNDILSGDLVADASLLGRGVDTLDGGAGDDRMFLGDGDIATGGDGQDLFSVAQIAMPDAGPAHITDFSTGTPEIGQPDTGDTLEILYEPAGGAGGSPALGIGYDADTDLTTVTVDGAAVVTLMGNVGLTVDDIVLTDINTV